MTLVCVVCVDDVFIGMLCTYINVHLAASKILPLLPGKDQLGCLSYCMSVFCWKEQKVRRQMFARGTSMHFDTSANVDNPPKTSPDPGKGRGGYDMSTLHFSPASPASCPNSVQSHLVYCERAQ